MFAETPARIAKTQVMKIARLRQRFGIAHALCFVLLVALVALRIIDPPPLEDLRNRAFDFYQFARPRVAEQRPVVILDIDEAPVAVECSYCCLRCPMSRASLDFSACGDSCS